jgi:hypothetical protein
MFFLSILCIPGVIGVHFLGEIERMSATGVGPKKREGDLVLGPLLKKKLSFVIQKEHGKGPVKLAGLDVAVLL